jgi:hypothetical protein
MGTSRGAGAGRALDDLARLNVFPSEIGVDLLVFAAHVHAADTRISRTTESQDTLDAGDPSGGSCERRCALEQLLANFRPFRYFWTRCLIAP